MAIAKAVGKDRRGKLLYKRDKQGREIVNRDLYPRFRDSTVLDFLPVVEPSGRIADDDLPTIAQLYRETPNAQR